MGRPRKDPVPESAKSPELMEAMAKFADNPLGFVYAAFPWKQAGRLFESDGPDTWQIKVLDLLGEMIRKGQNPGVAASKAIRIAVASGHGAGKALKNSTIVPTPYGPSLWGNIKKGDYLFGKNGFPVKVLARHDQGVKKIYRVTFDDGSFVHCCAEHNWSVRGRAQRRVDRPGGASYEWVTMTTAEIMKAGVKRPNGASEARQWEIPQQGAAQFPTAPVPVDPYTLGAWLGDGCRNTGRISKPYPELFERIVSNGEVVGPISAGMNRTVHGLKTRLRKLEILHLYGYDRFVPDLYKHNSIEVRSEVLRGLLDTDGDISKNGSITYTSTSQQLAEDVMWLARSLGGKARISGAFTKQYSHHGEKLTGRPAWRVTLTMPRDFQPFYIPHKAERFRPIVEDRYLARWIDSIEEDGEEEAMCVTVDAEDGLYLTNDFIVTHNSALVAWIILWFMSTREDPQIVVTANTQTQLRTKTWRELAVWHRLLLNSEWFRWTATTFSLIGREDTWFATAQAWSKENAEAFAGTHEKNVLIIFDEASAIPDEIWEVAEGAMTTPGAIWLAFGNPTKNTGRFRECWRRFRDRWYRLQVDSRTAKMVNKTQAEEWVKDYGEDSDFVRVRVKGQFPRASSAQLIPGDMVEAAMGRTVPPEEYEHAAIVMGVDPARFGDDQSVIVIRQGRKLLDIRKFRGLDTVQLAAEVVNLLRSNYTIDACFIDAVGIGAGVYDNVVAAGYDEIVFECNAGWAPLDTMHYFNRRTEIWVETREWLKNADLPEDDDEILTDLTSPEYFFSNKQQLMLESKKDMKARGLPSPDVADALTMTFWMPVEPKSAKVGWRDQLRLDASSGRNASWMGR